MLVTCQSVTTVVHLIQHHQRMVVLYIIFIHNEYNKSDSDILESLLFYINNYLACQSGLTFYFYLRK